MTQPKILGVLNVSPESNIKESIATTREAILERAKYLWDNGTTYIDLGGRSITPTADKISDEMELERVLPVIDLLKGQGCKVSIDTWSAHTAITCLEQGVDMINFTGEILTPEMLKAVAAADVPLVCTYMPYGDAYQMRGRKRQLVTIEAIMTYFRERIALAKQYGVKQIIFDPNLGILPDTLASYERVHFQIHLIRQIPTFQSLGYPVLVYAGRKVDETARHLLNSIVVHHKPEYIRTHTPEIITALANIELENL